MTASANIPGKARKNPKSNLASMGIYIFNWDILKKYLTEDENRSQQ